MQRHFNSQSFQGRKPFGRSRPSFTRGRNRRGQGEHIDISRFINKAVITEQVENFVPEHAFSDFQVDERIKKSIVAKKYTTPTPIQDKVIPHILRGTDVVGIANTGTGKTAAFLIPLINKILLQPTENVLVIVPTRELAIQINQELKEFTRGLRIDSVCIVGGASIGRQIAELRRRNHFIIGTPGRLKDLMNRRFINPAKFGTIVLDEADRMLDMGFIGDMRFIIAAMPQKRHTLLFSATLSREIQGLMGEFLVQPAIISVKVQDTSKNVDQDIIELKPGDTKIDVLQQLLKKPEFNKVLVFGRTKHGVERLSKILIAQGFKAESIHGDKNHSKRQRALGMFKDNHVHILVATDVAARGLDIADVSHVINYDLPATYDDYVHRIGRTGRGSKTGKALTFVE
ncbi:DEAD/DEAH box helicase [Candidatus Parcubacteria bacterium]|nr:DEAD/DEAH box helicase [Candidatus Parcubacteria bacterium]